jgi:hypothetical protein
VRDLLESDTMSDDMSHDAAVVRAEWRAEEEAWSRAALERWEHGRRLADVVRDAMQRGDAVSFAFASSTWSGVVVAVADDVVCVDTGVARVAIRLTSSAPFVLRMRADDRADRGARGAALTTFLARLRELDGTEVCIGTSNATLEGAMRVGHDQVRLTDRDGSCAYIPTGSVSWVRPLDDD